MQRIVIQNASSLLTDAVAQTVVAPLQKQLDDYLAPAWGKSAQLVFMPQSQSPLPTDWVVALLDNTDTAGALGYHDITKTGLPLSKVFIETAQKYGYSWTATTSHETCEMLVDSEINLTATRQTRRTIEFYAQEACDACEDDSYGMTIDGVLLSDILTPAWFAQKEGGPYDVLKHITAPFELLPGGYNGVFIPGRGWTQVTHAEKQKATLFRGGVGTRRERRRIGREEWVRSTAV